MTMPWFGRGVSRLLNIWVWVIDHFLIDRDNSEQLRQTHTIVITIFVLSVIAVPFVVQYWNMDLPFMSLAVIATVCLGLSDLVLLKKTKNILLCGTIATACLFLLLTLSNITSGGFYDPNFSWYYVIPVMGMVATNKSMGWVWTVVILLTTWIFWMLPSWGIVLTNKIPIADHAGQSLANRLSAIAAISGLATAFLVSQGAAEKKLKSTLHLLSLEVIERKDAEEKAYAASQAKSNFLANMSHEIRTPMNGVLGMTYLLLNSKLEDQQKQYANIIMQSAESLLTIINDILDYSKIEAGHITIESEAIDVIKVVENVCELIKIPAQTKNLSISSKTINESGGEFPKVIGDRGRIRQVLMNLVGNAIKFSDSSEVKIHVSSRHLESGYAQLRFEVRDHGIGIQRDRLQAVFGKFTQADDSTTRIYGGTGLGLAISKQLVELMGGEIGVESVYGQGSTFWFSLNLPISEQAREHKTDWDIDKKLLAEARILIVDDNEANRLVARKLLESMGCRVHEAWDGSEACSKVAEEIFDLILMDCMMPKMDGFQATSAIRKNESDKRIPIVAMTSNASSKYKVKCLDVGMDAVITKPIIIADFTSILGRYFNKES
jgi:signal transduction histidine kinase/CheY-like chemotaxis protein